MHCYAYMKEVAIILVYYNLVMYTKMSAAIISSRYMKQELCIGRWVASRWDHELSEKKHYEKELLTMQFNHILIPNIVACISSSSNNHFD